MLLATLLSKMPRVLSSTRSRITYHNFRQMLHTSSRLNSSSAWNDEFAGLTLANPKVKQFLQKITDEYEDLSRSEQRSRAGHRRFATLTPLLKILETRNETLENLDQLETEMKSEQDTELLALIEEEKNVNVVTYLMYRIFFNCKQIKVFCKFVVRIGDPAVAFDFLTHRRRHVFVAHLRGVDRSWWPGGHAVRRRNVRHVLFVFCVQRLGRRCADGGLDGVGWNPSCQRNRQRQRCVRFAEVRGRSPSGAAYSGNGAGRQSAY